MFIESARGDRYINAPLGEQGVSNSRPVNTPGTAALKTPDNEVQLTPEEHKAYRRAAGKLQWMTYTRPDNCYATKELVRDLTGPTTRSQQKLKPPVEVSTRNQKLELHRNASIHSEQGWNRDRRLHRCGMSRMPSYMEIGNRIWRTSRRPHGPLRNTSTSRNSSAIPYTETLHV